MTTQTAATIIREAYMAAPDNAEQSADHDGCHTLTIGNRRLTMNDEGGEDLGWTEYAAVHDPIDPDRIVDWDVVTSDGCSIEDAEQARSAALAFVA